MGERGSGWACMASEMESAAMFAVAAALGVPERRLLPCDLESGA